MTTVLPRLSITSMECLQVGEKGLIPTKGLTEEGSWMTGLLKQEIE